MSSVWNRAVLSFPHCVTCLMDLIRLVCKMPLSARDKERLQNVVVNAIHSRDRREFRSYCKLACTVDSEGLREQVQERLTDADPDVQRRARWVLSALSS